ncbi:MAG: Calx-beta domain-containing protein [Burkholderiales bacterium]
MSLFLSRSRPTSTFAAKLASGIAIAALTGCAHQSTTIRTAASAIPASKNECATIDPRDDRAVSRVLDINDLMLTALRKFGKTDNAGVCAMSWDERNNVMLAHRNTLKDPNRKALRAPSKEYIRTWDADDNGNQPTSTQKLLADTKRRAMGIENASGLAKAAGIRQNNWTFLGPGNVGGRIRAIVFDPRNSNRFFIGAATGGIWLTTNAGQTKRPLADFSGNLAIGAMAIDPVNPDVVYAGTGESFAGFAGVGVFKSTDGGLTWNLLPSTSTDTAINPSGADWTTTNRIAVHSANPNIVLAGNGGGVYRSSNAGQTWTRVRTGTTLDVQFDPNVADRVIASGNGGFAYVSNDAGVTWTDAPKFFTNALRGSGGTARSEFAWAKSTPGLVYASVDNTDQTSGSRGEVYKSDDGGQTWTFLSSPKHMAQQGDYDNTIWVDPTNAANIVIGGLDLYRSVDGGLNFTRISTWQAAGPGFPQPHADHHQIVSPPNFSGANPVVYIGNDGGLVRSTNIFSASANGTSTWQNLNNELGITQFYGGAGSSAAGGRIIGGTQDNGDLLFDTGTTWSRIGGGDGGYAAVDPSGNTAYGEYVYASIRRYGGAGSGYICNGITEGKKDEGGGTFCGPNATEQTNFITPFILDPNSPDRMLVGANSLWVSDDVRTVAAPAWRAIKPPVTNPNSTRYINAIAVQNGNSNVIWVGHNASNTAGLPTHIFKTSNGLATTPQWVNVAASGMPTAAINRITIDPDNPDRVWVSYSGFSADRLWVTDNGGTSWRPISAGLPAVTIHDMKRHPTQRDWLYVGAANGVYTSENSGVTWTSTNDGPNSVRVRELFWYDNFTLVAVTHGRGMFRVSALPENGVVSFQSATYAVSEGAGSASLSVQRLGNIGGPASVSYTTAAGTATAGADYTTTSGTLSWPAGDGSTKVIVVPVIDDSIAEGAESFTVTLSNPVGTNLGTAVATVTIADNEQGVFPPNCVLPTTGWSIPPGATAGWQVATDSASEGICSLKSAPIGDNAKAQIAFTGNFVAGNVTFDRRVSSESTYDCLQFLIDGVAQNIGSNCSGANLVGASGDVPWGSVSLPVTAGTHTLTWSYVKDENTIEGLDAAWIDKLVMPLAGSTTTMLTVTRSGTGTGTVSSSPAGINCGTTCSFGFTGSPVVTLTAQPSSGSFFAGWTGCTSATATTCQITVDTAKSVTAAFSTLPALPPLARRGGVDIDGQGRSALVVRAASNNQLQAGRLVNNVFQWTNMADPGPDFRLIAALDFAGNGKSDLPMLRDNPALLNANGQGTAQFWPDFIGTSPVVLRDVKPAWDVQAVGDLDGDGFGDLVWRFRGQSANIDDQGVSYIWFTNGSGVTQVRKRGGAPLTWTLLGAADLNLDGAMDMIYVSPANAMRALMATAARTCANLNAGSIPTGFTALKLADFTGNRRGDVLSRNASTGEVRVISLNGSGLSLPAFTGDPDDQNASCTGSTLSLQQTVQTFTSTTDPTWTYLASGDFNGDGIFDIVWKRPDNTLVVWLMSANGAAPTILTNAGTAPASTSPLSLQ